MNRTKLTINIELSGDGYCELLEFHNKKEFTRTQCVSIDDSKITISDALRLIKEELFYYGY